MNELIASPAVTLTVPNSSYSQTIGTLGASGIMIQCEASTLLTMTFTVSIDPVTASSASFTTWPVVNRKTGVVKADGAGLSVSSGDILYIDLNGISQLKIARVSGSGTLVYRLWDGDMGSAMGDNVSLLAGFGSILVDDAAFTPGASGVLPMGFEADETATDSVDEGDVGAARMTLDRTQLVTAGLRSDELRIAGTSVTPKFAFANVAASQTDSSIVAAVASKKIRVLSFRLHTGATATNVTFNTKPAGAGSAISELFALSSNGGRAEGFSPVGHFQTAAGEGLTVTTGAGSTTGIGVVYIEV